MFELRPSCECCDTDLPVDQTGAVICSFDCTFCEPCAEGVLGGACPNCGGGFSPRPVRAGAALARYPASTRRIVKAQGCV